MRKPCLAPEDAGASAVAEDTPKKKNTNKKGKQAQTFLCIRCSRDKNVMKYSDKLPKEMEAGDDAKKAKKKGNPKSSDAFVLICDECLSGYQGGGWNVLAIKCRDWAWKCSTDTEFNAKAEVACKVAAGKMPVHWANEGVQTAERLVISSIARYGGITEESFGEIVDTPLDAKTCNRDKDSFPDAFGKKKQGCVVQAFAEGSSRSGQAAAASVAERANV